MAIITAYIGLYSRQIYLDGVKSFTGHNGTPAIPTEYHGAVKKYAVDKFYDFQIINALNNNYITQEEYDDTLTYGTPKTP
jgi:hypothetical protein